MSNKITKKQRFSEALSLICGSEVPSDLVDRWISGQSEELQDWVGTSAVPWWLQGIGAIDAATAMADTPIEGQPQAIEY